MQLLLVSDIHMDCDRLERLIAQAGTGVDYVVCAGDLTNYGNRSEIARVIERLRCKPVLAIPGNLDTMEGLRGLEEEGYSIHARRRTIDSHGQAHGNLPSESCSREGGVPGQTGSSGARQTGNASITLPGGGASLLRRSSLGCEGWTRASVIDGWSCVGFGGGGPEFVGEVLFTDAELVAAVEPLLKDTISHTTILVTHQPPFDTTLDRVRGATHRGSRAVRALIERFQPAYQICGHIHESWGEDRIGTTRCLNVAAVKEGRAALLDLATGTVTRLQL